MNVLSLCAGIGGLELGLERAGMTVVGQVEINEFCRRVLAKHWPKVDRHDDVRTAVEWWRSADRPELDLIAMGFPCQPQSLAGLRLGPDDPRWLWPACAEVVRELEPEWVLFENVPGLRTLGLGDVLADLHDLGYECRVGYLSACAMGAPHTRDRLFGVAHAAGKGRGAWRTTGAGEELLEPQRRGEECGRPWSVEPRPHGVAYGVPRGVDRRRALGNAVVPAAGEFIGRLIMSSLEAA